MCSRLVGRDWARAAIHPEGKCARTVDWLAGRCGSGREAMGRSGEAVRAQSAQPHTQVSMTGRSRLRSGLPYNREDRRYRGSVTLTIHSSPRFYGRAPTTRLPLRSACRRRGEVQSRSLPRNRIRPHFAPPKDRLPHSDFIGGPERVAWRIGNSG